MGAETWHLRLRTLRPSGRGFGGLEEWIPDTWTADNKAIRANGDVLMVFARSAFGGIGQNAETEEGREGRTGSQEVRERRAEIHRDWEATLSGFWFSLTGLDGQTGAGMAGCIDCKSKKRKTRVGKMQVGWIIMGSGYHDLIYNRG